MSPLVKDKKKRMKAGNLGQVQGFIEKAKEGEVTPFKEKTEKARKDLKAGLIK